MDIKVLGPGCANCTNTFRLIEAVAAEKGLAVQLEKVDDLKAIMGYGVLSTPGVVIDGKVVHSGSVPSRDKVAGWFAGSKSLSSMPIKAETTGGCCGGCC